MSQFKNIFHTLKPGSKFDFKHLAQIRKTKLEREGHSTDCINWEHYAKVLEAKHQRLATTS
jgi:hypothetical protein